MAEKASYYSIHETAYQRMRTRKEFGWQLKTAEEFDTIYSRETLKMVVPKYFPLTKGLFALDLGCGTGPTAHVLFEYGFEVTGVDVSQTSIELARELASIRERPIDFVVGDALTLQHLSQKFDLIYDSHCFHCIVLEEDRARAFVSVRDSLTPTGVFVLDTMVFTPGSKAISGEDGLRFDENYILWHKTSRADLTGVAEKDGSLWCPQRRIYPAEVIRSELLRAGFEIIEWQIEDAQASDTKMLKALCKT